MPGSRVSMANAVFPVTLSGTSKRLTGCPSSFHSLGIFEGDFLRDIQFGGVGSHRTILHLSFAGRVCNNAARNDALCSAELPTFGRQPR